MKGRWYVGFVTEAQNPESGEYLRISRGLGESETATVRLHRYDVQLHPLVTNNMFVVLGCLK